MDNELSIKINGRKFVWITANYWYCAKYDLTWTDSIMKMELYAAQFPEDQ
jgi:hypothetical protein